MTSMPRPTTAAKKESKSQDCLTNESLALPHKSVGEKFDKNPDARRCVQVVPPKMEWIFGEYFGQMGAVFGEYGLFTLANLAVLASNVSRVDPEPGSLSACPSLEARSVLFEGQRLLNIKGVRDAALELLSDRHMFQRQQSSLQLAPNKDYAMIVSNKSLLNEPLLFEAKPAKDEGRYAGAALRIHEWSEKSEKLMQASDDKVTLLRVRYDPPSN